MAQAPFPLTSAARRWKQVPVVGLTLAATSAVGAIAALHPDYVATAAFGAPVLVGLASPRLYLWSWLGIIMLAPLSAYVKAFTGLPYAPLVLDVGTLALA